MSACALSVQHGDDTGYYRDQTSGQVDGDKRQKERCIGRKRYPAYDSRVSVQADFFLSTPLR